MAAESRACGSSRPTISVIATAGLDSLAQPRTRPPSSRSNPGKGYSVTMPRPALCPTYPLIFEEHRVAVTPFASGYRLGSTMEFAGYDESLNRSRLASSPTRRIVPEGSAAPNRCRKSGGAGGR